MPSRAVDSHLARFTSPLPRVVLGLGPSSTDTSSQSHTLTHSLRPNPQPQPQSHAHSRSNQTAHAFRPKVDQQELQLQHHHVVLPHLAYPRASATEGATRASIAATGAGDAAAAAKPPLRGSQQRVGGSAAGDLPRQVSEATAAVTEQLARQGMARLEAWGSQGRAAAVLALCCVSEALLEAEGLGVVAAVEGTRQWMHLRQALAGENGEDKGAIAEDVVRRGRGPGRLGLYGKGGWLADG